MSDTVTLALQGEVSLPDFAAAVDHFNRLVVALTTELNVEDVFWRLDSLEYGSAVTTARGVPQNGTTPGQIESVVRAFLAVGQSLEQGRDAPYAAAVRKEAQALVRLANKPAVEAVRFETAESEAIVRSTGTMKAIVAPPREESYGSVTGRAQTLTSRNALRFTLYDHIHDRAVSCYLVPGREDMMRQMWDRVVSVEGWLSRDPATGRPMTVRRVSKVTPLHEVAPHKYMSARGVLMPNEDELPETLTRRLRDA